MSAAATARKLAYLRDTPLQQLLDTADEPIDFFWIQRARAFHCGWAVQRAGAYFGANHPGMTELRLTERSMTMMGNRP